MNRKPANLTSPPPLLARIGHNLLDWLDTVRGIGAFSLIILGVIVDKRGKATAVMTPRIRHEIARSGSDLIPMFGFLALALGFLVVGLSVAQLSLFQATGYVGLIIDTVLVRELGPLLAAMMILARVGAANVIELGTARATGEVETLEALGIDPIHYLVVPRVIGMAVGVFALTICLILGSLGGGYVWAFLIFPKLSLTPAGYAAQIADSLNQMDFLLLTLKTLTFGFFIAVVSCYHGLAEPLRLDGISRVTVKAITHGIILCTLLDLIFLVFTFLFATTLR